MGFVKHLSTNITYSGDPWSNLFQDDYATYGSKSSFKFLLDFTFYRPRDIVLFLSEIGNNDYQYPINSKCFKTLIKKFINSNIKELKSELSIHFTEKEVLDLLVVLREICDATTPLSREQVLQILKENILTQEASKVLDLMLDYSILFFKDSDDKLYFNYRENGSESVDFSKMKLTTHKSIYKYFYPERIY